MENKLSNVVVASVRPIALEVKPSVKFGADLAFGAKLLLLFKYSKIALHPFQATYP